MSQHEERARAVKQARKLMEMTTAAGASETEAEFAMKRLGEIQDVYNLTLDEIVLETLDYKKIELKGTLIKGCPMEDVVVALGKFTDTKVWRTPGQKIYARSQKGRWRQKAVEVSTYCFFGLEADIEMASFLYNYIKNTLDHLEEEFKKTDKYTRCLQRGESAQQSQVFVKV